MTPHHRLPWGNCLNSSYVWTWWSNKQINQLHWWHRLYGLRLNTENWNLCTGKSDALLVHNNTQSCLEEQLCIVCPKKGILENIILSCCSDTYASERMLFQLYYLFITITFGLPIHCWAENKSVFAGIRLSTSFLQCKWVNVMNSWWINLHAKSSCIARKRNIMRNHEKSENKVLLRIERG